MATVTLEHVSKQYRDVVAVRDLSIEIADGELLVLVGPSGCGKTTVLRLIAGLEVPDDGTILIDGRVVNDVAPSARNVAMVFENYALYPHLLVRQNLDFALRIHRTPAEEIRRRVSAVAASMELGGLLERKPPGLAAGEAQHVALGRAVVRDTPAVFLLDDALSHLDARQRLAARAELGRLHRELRTTIVSVTHDQAEALAVGTRVAVMDAGVLQQAGPPRTLYEHPGNVFVAGFIGSPPMNLVEMTLERDGDRTVLRSGTLTLPAPERIAGPAAGSIAPHVTIGIRPEHIRVAAPPGDGDAGFRGQCDLVEFLGQQVLVHLRVGDLQLTAFDDPARRVRAGDIVDCSIPLDRLHLFDSRTGRELDASAALVAVEG
jgi:multiple sugar transport system ATP-binding protein